MALPALTIGQDVFFFPSNYDAGLMTDGLPGPVPAKVTKVDTASQTVNLIVFPDLQLPVFREGVPYGADITEHENLFYLTTDVPACTEEKSDVAILDTSATNFVVHWTNPASFVDSGVYYRTPAGSGPWLKAGAPGNEPGVSAEDEFTFTDLTIGDEYEIKVVNFCNNRAESPGVIVSDFATTPV